MKQSNKTKRNKHFNNDDNDALLARYNIIKYNMKRKNKKKSR